MKIAKRVASMQLTPTRRYNKYGKQAEEAGKKVYRINIGQSDIKTPDCFMDAIRNFRDDTVSYSDIAGVNDLLDAVINYNKIYDMEFSRENIIITNGGSEALSFVFNSVLDPGDEVIMAEPYYAGYSHFASSVNASIVPVTTRAEDGYAWARTDMLEAAVTAKTRAICCISPGNPTGRVLSLEEMRIIGNFAKAHDLWIISDEVYREFTYDGRKVTSFGMLPEFEDRVIIIDSVSKKFSACGARIGAVICKNPELIDAVLKFAQGKLSVPTLEQIGAAALYNLRPSYFENAKSVYEARRDAAYEEISKIPGVICEKSGGAFYLMAKLPIDDAEDFLIYMLTEFEDNGETVMFTPAEGFYQTPGLGRNEIRVAYILETDKMRRAVELIRLGLKAYTA